MGFANIEKIFKPSSIAVVGDPWQGKGLGRRLLEVLLGVGHDYRIKRMAGVVMQENTRMLALCRDMGFRVKLNRSENVYEVDIDFPLKEEPGEPGGRKDA